MSLLTPTSKIKRPGPKARPIGYRQKKGKPFLKTIKVKSK